MAFRRQAPSKPEPPNGATLQYLTETLDLLTLPEPVSPTIPPLDLSDWEDPEADAIAEEDVDMESLIDRDDSPGLPHVASPVFLLHVAHTHTSHSNGTSTSRSTSSADAMVPMSRTASASSILEPKQPLQEAREAFSKETLKRLAVAARDRGRTVKHAGDARIKPSRNPSKKDHDIALLELVDSVLLYVYSFWCEDLLAGRLDEHGRLTKPTCVFDNWKTIFGLLSFVRSRATKANWTILTSLINLVEALIIRHMAVSERRNLHAQVERQLAASKHSDTASNASSNHNTPSSTVATPPIGAFTASTDVISSQQAQSSYDAFLKYSSNVERATKLFQGSQDVCSLSHLRHALPDLFQICVGSMTERKQVCQPHRPWQFTFALDTNGGYAALCHVVCFGRATLECMAKQKELNFSADWDPMPVT